MADWDRVGSGRVVREENQAAEGARDGLWTGEGKKVKEHEETGSG